MAGGPVVEKPERHLPVMAGDVMALTAAAPGQIFVDLTVGAGGHASAFLASSAPTGRVIACDRDAVALEIAERTLAAESGRVRFVHADSVSALALLAQEGCRADIVLADLGVSSMQLDDADRGFSLRVDAALDMRMDPRQKVTAVDILNHWNRTDLTQLLREAGDEPRAERIAEAICERRRSRPFRTTGDLRRVVEDALGRRGGRIHPATRTFQAVRIGVNRELELLRATLDGALELLAPGGRLAVIAFHSGEDRLVKAFMRACAGQGHELVTRGAVKPGRDEQRVNRRSRSARLRVLRKAGGDAGVPGGEA